ncbi:hypothetical protein UFOVP451_46 [uncultured Caudovirales phage]|uniref:Uncharacterized protein n=1 Tax=uncultured Caudovirales phage TaxID=2100421 RepID=A0A6J5MC70_9CAUD|nr:hypothetical protein UFOVP451_46 [uncultured Caudovirales phage]
MQPNIIIDFEGDDIECPTCEKRFAGQVLTDNDIAYCCQDCYDVWSAFPTVTD